MQRQLVRSIVRISLDVSGNISYFARVQDCELDLKFTRLTSLFTEVKVLSMKATLIPTTAIRNTNLQLGALFVAVVHEDYTALQSIGDLVREIPNVTYHPMPDTKPLVKTWHITPGDASEEEFYSSQGTTISRIIPASLGGILFWCDGPVGSTGTYVCDIILEWMLLYRGMRCA